MVAPVFTEKVIELDVTAITFVKTVLTGSATLNVIPVGKTVP